VLNQASRALVLAAIRKHCALRGWNLLAAYVKSNHVHAIVESETRPERIMNEFKSYASRELNRLARHGSTRWLWKDEDVRHALRYVIDEQGERMALFVDKEIERDPQLSAPSRSRLGIEP
jgi:REP element-mobilizing transposase RayT